MAESGDFEPKEKIRRVGCGEPSSINDETNVESIPVGSIQSAQVSSSRRTEALPSQPSAWRTFPKFRSPSGSWGPFGIRIERRHVYEFHDEIIVDAVRESGITEFILPEKLSSYYVFRDYMAKLKAAADDDDSDECEEEGKYANMFAIAREVLEKQYNMWKQPREGLHSEENVHSRVAAYAVLKYLLQATDKMKHALLGTVHGFGHCRIVSIMQTIEHQPQHVLQELAKFVINGIWMWETTAGMTRHSSTLSTLNKDFNKTCVTTKPDLEIASNVQFVSLRLPKPYTLLVGEVNEKIPPADLQSEPEVLDHCGDTVHEHLGQLLVCMRDSLFARGWNATYPGSTKTPPAGTNVNHIFGFMQHGTKIQLTCLRLSKLHLSRIVAEQRSVHIPDGGRGDTTTSRDCNSSSSADKQFTNQHPGPLNEKGTLFISNPIDLLGLLTGDGNFECMMKFFYILSQYGEISEVHEDRNFKLSSICVI